MAKDVNLMDAPVLFETDTPEIRAFRRAQAAYEEAKAESENARNAAKERKKSVNKAVVAVCDAHDIKPDDEGRYRFTVDGYTVIRTHLDRCVVKSVKDDGDGAAPKRGRKRKGG